MPPQPVPQLLPLLAPDVLAELATEPASDAAGPARPPPPLEPLSPPVPPPPPPVIDAVHAPRLAALLALHSLTVTKQWRTFGTHMPTQSEGGQPQCIFTAGPDGATHGGIYPAHLVEQSGADRDTIASHFYGNDAGAALDELLTRYPEILENLSRQMTPVKLVSTLGCDATPARPPF